MYESSSCSTPFQKLVWVVFLVNLFSLQLFQKFSFISTDKQRGWQPLWKKPESPLPFAFRQIHLILCRERETKWLTENNWSQKKESSQGDILSNRARGKCKSWEPRGWENRLMLLHFCKQGRELLHPGSLKSQHVQAILLRISYRPRYRTGVLSLLRKSDSRHLCGWVVPILPTLNVAAFQLHRVPGDGSAAGVCPSSNSKGHHWRSVEAQADWGGNV